VFVHNKFICDTGARNPSLVGFAFLLNHILHCICFKVLVTESKYLVSNWSYTRLVRAIKKVKQSNKKFNIFRVIVILSNNYFIIMKIFLAIKGFLLYQIKQTALKSDYNFTSDSEFTNTSWIEELQTRNLSLLFRPLAQYLGSDRRRVLSPCVTYISGPFIYILCYYVSNWFDVMNKVLF